MSDNESSGLSSAPSEDENDLQLTKKDGILKFFSKVPAKSKAAPKEASPPRPKREPSPPHEYVLADNTDIAFIVMFRSRFTEAFQKSLINFGPQELERDVVSSPPGEVAENFLCALLGLLLNRKQDVKAGHYNRALEEAIQTHKSQWAKDWESKNPLSGGASFASMIPTQRLTLLKTLILWSLASSDIVKGIIQTSYKQNRHDDDLNQPLSVQPWGSDGDKRRYYLIEGLDDTHFRVYRESNHMSSKRTWFSVAGDIEELKVLSDKLTTQDGGQKARLLSQKMMSAIPRFEATEEKRKRREYRQQRKQQFKRPDVGFSNYEGRTRGGKRMRYTFSEEEDDEGYSDDTSTRRSTRNTGTHTPADGPTITQSGRQVKSRQGGAYGESMLSGQVTNGDAATATEEMSGEVDEIAGGRPRRAAVTNSAKNGYPKKNIDNYNDVDDMSSDEEGDASEQDYGDDEEEDDNVPLESDEDDQDELTEDEDAMEGIEKDKPKLIIKLPVKTPTPEKKTIIKLRLSPEKEKTKPANLFSPKSKSGSPGEIFIAESNGKTGITPPNGNASLEWNGNSEVTPSDENGFTTKTVDVPPMSPSQQPLSPLAFRGSTEKPPQSFSTVDVGV